MIEKFPQDEFSEGERDLIAKLKEKPPDDQEVHEALVAWCVEEEKKILALTEVNEIARADVQFNLKKARLYRAAGYVKQAWESLDWAREGANNINAEDLFAEAEAMADEMDAENR